MRGEGECEPAVAHADGFGPRRRPHPLRAEVVGGLQVAVRHLPHRQRAREAPLLVLDARRDVAVAAAVEHVQVHPPPLRIEGGRDVEVRERRAVRRRRVGRRVQPHVERAVAALPAVLHEGEVGGLEEEAVLGGHDRRDDVDHLREVGHLHHVRVPEERVEEEARRQRVLEVVSLLQAVLLARAVPHVPLVVGDGDRARVGAPRADLADQRGGGVDVAVDRLRPRHVLLEVVVSVADVGVDRDEVDLVAQRLEDRPVPADPVGAVVARAAGDQADRRIDGAHDLGRLEREPRVLAGRLVAELPRAVHLVAEAPVLHAVGRRVAVLAPLVGPPRRLRLVRVLDPVARLVHGAQAEVDRDVGRGADLGRVLQELVGAEAVRLDGVPRQVEPRRPQVLRADAVLPVIAGDEVAARPAQDRHAEVLHGPHDVGAVPVRVGERAALVVDAPVDHAAEVLGEAAEEPRVHVADDAVDVDLDPGLERRAGLGRRAAPARRRARARAPARAAPAARRKAVRTKGLLGGES